MKYLLRKCEEANFISHRPKGDISQFPKEIISHSASPNISLEKHHIAAGDASFPNHKARLDLFDRVCYNMLEGRVTSDQK